MHAHTHFTQINTTQYFHYICQQGGKKTIREGGMRIVRSRFGKSSVCCLVLIKVSEKAERLGENLKLNHSYTTIRLGVSVIQLFCRGGLYFCFLFLILYSCFNKIIIILPSCEQHCGRGRLLLQRLKDVATCVKYAT